jgi:prolyl-tRNA synthetase
VIKEEIAAEIIMLPLDEDADDPEAAREDVEQPEADTCAICDEPAEHVAYFAKTY